MLSLGSFTIAQAQFAGKRQVIVFGGPESKAFRQQVAMLKKEAAGIKERDIAVTLAGRETAWYKKHNVAPAHSFMLILIGKDGGEKYRSGKPTTAQHLFAIIDAMPMRQAEMRRHKQP